MPGEVRRPDAEQSDGGSRATARGVEPQFRDGVSGAGIAIVCGQSPDWNPPHAAFAAHVVRWSLGGISPHFRSGVLDERRRTAPGAFDRDRCAFRGAFEFRRHEPGSSLFTRCVAERVEQPAGGRNAFLEQRQTQRGQTGGGGEKGAFVFREFDGREGELHRLLDPDGLRVDPHGDPIDLGRREQRVGLVGIGPTGRHEVGQRDGVPFPPGRQRYEVQPLAAVGISDLDREQVGVGIATSVKDEDPPIGRPRVIRGEGHHRPPHATEVGAQTQSGSALRTWDFLDAGQFDTGQFALWELDLVLAGIAEALNRRRANRPRRVVEVAASHDNDTAARFEETGGDDPPCRRQRIFGGEHQQPDVGAVQRVRRRGVDGLKLVPRLLEGRAKFG